MKLPDFEYMAPSTATEVVSLLVQRRGEAKIISGGQSLLPTMAFRLTQPSLLVDLKNIAGLDHISINEDGLVLGARIRWCDIENDHRLCNAHPLLAEAVSHVAHYQIRNRGTVGGSLAHADPAAELPCIAATCGAEMRVLGPEGERIIGASDYFLGPLTTALADDDVILEVRFPPWPSARRWAFREFSRRTGDFALAGVAVFYDPDAAGLASNVHIGIVGACYQSGRLPLAEAALTGKPLDAETARFVAGVASGEIDPPDDVNASADYRRSLVKTLLEQALLEAQSRSV